MAVAAQIWAWRGRHPVLARILILMAIGLGIEITLTLFDPPALTVLRHVGDDTADRMMQLAERTTASDSGGPGFVLVDIDDASWSAWGEPLITPRDRLAGVIARVALARPSVILLDVDLAFPDASNGEAAMRAMISAYPVDGPPLVLTRSVKTRPGTPLPVARETAFDAVSAGHPRVVWGIPSFERGADGVLRRWQLAVAACAGGRPIVIPSVQLQVAVLAAPAPLPTAERLAMLAQALAPLTPADCATPASVTKLDLALKPVGAAALLGGPIRVDAAGPSSRLIYTIPWQSGVAALGPRGRDGSAVVQVRTAHTVARVPADQPLEGFAGRIAVIGGSFADSGDWHATPLGEMPGALVLINAIRALQMHGTPQPPPWWDRLAISFAMTTLVAILTAVFRASVAAVLSAIGILGLMVATLAQFKSGIILDLATPSIGIIVYDLVKTWGETLWGLRQQGWRWVLKPPPAGTGDASP